MARSALGALMTLLAACGTADVGTVRLRTVEGGVPVPARLELTDPSGRQFVPHDALAVAGDCGWLPVHNWIPWWAGVQLARARQVRVHDVTAGTDQFYIDGELEIDLPPRDYRLRAFKGPEHAVAETRFTVGAGERTEVDLGLQRWIDMPSRGWFGADDHLHIPRPYPSYDLTLLRWMAAEDLHVANLLQMGLAQEFHITPQRAFGPQSVSSRGSHLVASGQENPRTHVVGHAIILGAHEYIDFPERYLSYDLFFREARRQGGINGFAHWGLGGADEGLATWGPEGLLDFLEVLGFGVPYYGTWYDLLDLGLRVTPTAGTDYPCGPYLPGRQRFYTRVEGELTYQTWLEGVEAGHTFVTNGPMLELRVGEAEIGDELRLMRPTDVRVEGRVHFDPRRDDVDRLELVQAGLVVAYSERSAEPGLLELAVTLPINSSTWLALRAGGTKRGETPLAGMTALEQALFHLPRPASRELFGGDDPAIPRDGAPRPSAAHTAPVYATVAGTPAIAEQPGARRAASRWLERLDLLESRFEPGRLEEMAGFPGRGDGLSLEDLERARNPLLERIAATRAWLERVAEQSDE